MKYRILSLDGGGQLEMTSTLLLMEIEKRRPGFLANTDMIAGTSAGAMVALILATQDDPAALLPQTEELWEKFFQLSMNSLAGMALGLFGLGAIFSNQRLEQFLAQPDLLGSKTLGELRKKVIITSFDMEGTDPTTGRKTWKPKVYDNYGKDNPDLQELAVDVALRSGAAPIMFPIVDGFVDGGVFANDPALVAVTKVFHDWRTRPIYGVPWSADVEPGPDHTHEHLKDPVREHLGDLRVLSIGVGSNDNYVPVMDANWGYLQWLLNPAQPLLAINALLRGSSLAIDFQCNNLLPDGGYHRLNPFFIRNAAIPFMINTNEIRKTVEMPETQAMVDQTIAWLDEFGWFGKDPDEAAIASTPVTTTVTTASTAPASTAPASAAPASTAPTSKAPKSKTSTSKTSTSKTSTSKTSASKTLASEEPASKEPVSEEPASKEPVP